MANIGELSAKIVISDQEAIVALTSVENKSKQAEASLNKLGAVGLASMTALGVGVKQVTDEATKFQNTMMGLETVASRTVGDVQAVTQAAQDLAADGLMTVDEAAGGLKNLLASGFGLPEAIALMNGFKDSASFNRQASLDFGYAVVSATEGIKNQNSILVDNAGLTKNLSVIMKEAGLSIDDMSKISSDAGIRAQFLGGIMNNLALFTGDAERMAESFAGTQSRLGVESQKSAVALGTALQPMLMEVYQVLIPLIQKFTEFISKNPQVVQQFIRTGLTLAALAVSTSLAGQAFVLFNGIMTAVRGGMIATQLSAGALGAVMLGLGILFAKATMEESGLNKMLGATEKQSKTLGKETKDTGNAFKGFGDQGKAAGEKTKKSLEDALERIQDVKRAIQDENDEFNKQLADIESRRKKSIDQNKKALQKENDDFNKKQNERKKEYEKKTKDMELQNQQRIKDLEISMAESLVVGSSTYDEDFQMYQEMIEKEKDAGKDRMEELTKLYNEETAEQKKEYSERTSELQAKITEDEALLRKHAEVLKSINRSVLRDEIEELVYTHKRRLDELNKQLEKEKRSYGDAFKKINKDFKMNWDDINKYGATKPIDVGKMLKMPDMGKVLKRMGAEIVIGMYAISADLGKVLHEKVFQPVLQLQKKIAGTLGLKFIEKLVDKDIKTSKDFVKFLEKDKGVFAKEVRGIFGLAHGTRGYTTNESRSFVVGESGPERVTLPAGSRVESNSEMNSGRTVNQYNTFNVDKGNDIDAVLSSLSFQLRGL